MKISYLYSNSVSHAFSAEAGGSRCAFLVPLDYEATGHVEAVTGGFWPGNYPAFFESAPITDEMTGSPFRLRLTAAGVRACRAAQADAEPPLPPIASPPPCNCDLCRAARFEGREAEIAGAK